MRVISLFNLKGGTAKTTTSLVLAGIMSRKYNKRTLLVDLDPQGNSTIGSGVSKESLRQTVYHAVTGRCDPAAAVVKCARWDLLPSNIEAVRLNMDLRDYTTLSNRLIGLFRLYDIVLLDCPPSLSTVSMSALAASTHLVIPAEPESFGRASIKDMQFAVNGIRQYNPSLKVTGILLTQFDSRTNLAKRTRESIAKDADELLHTVVFEHTIRQSVAVAEAIEQGIPLVDYKRTPALVDYLGFTTELVSRL